VIGSVKVVKKRDDPLGVGRVSLGGPIVLEEGATGFYLVYRGPIEQAEMILQVCLGALKAQRVVGEPEISPDDGKQFA